MSSMFWFGENSRRRFDDFRPEVHDSDGLAIRTGNGERLWRPISNDTGKLEFSFFDMEKCDGFGLLQRDRRFAAYEDGEADYQLRPSLWIEPTSDWGPGRVMLMEIPTTNELSDNTVAMWEPARIPQPGDRIEFSYRQHWTLDEDPSMADGHVVATRTGVHDWQPEQRTMVVEFVGNALNQQSEIPLTPFIQATGAGAEKVKIQGITVQSIPDARWRVAFQIAPAAEGGKLSDVGPVELRCCLKRGENFLTETWVHRITP
jgi:glucans biosynthesis protein